MNKQYQVLVVTLLGSLILTACRLGGTSKPTNLLNAIKQRGYILVSTDPKYQPLSFLNNDGKRPADTKCPSEALTIAEMQGFDVDVAKAVGDSLGVETCFTTPTWDAITAGNWADKWDISVGSMTIKPARQKVLDFSVPYYYSKAVIAIRADSEIKALKELAGKALCVASATTYEDWLNGILDIRPEDIYIQPPAGIQIVSLETDQECAAAIMAGRDDFIGYAASEIVIDSNIADGMPVTKLGDPVFYERLAAAFDKASSLSSESLRANVDKLFTTMHSNGSLSEISKKWFKDKDGKGIDYTVEPK